MDKGLFDNGVYGGRFDCRNDDYMDGTRAIHSTHPSL